MPDWASWAGAVGTLVFGVLTMWQWIGNLKRNALWEANRAHLEAVYDHLTQILAMCCESVERGQIIKTPAQQQWVAQLGHNIRAVQHHIDAALKAMGKKQGHHGPLGTPPPAPSGQQQPGQDQRQDIGATGVN